MATARKLPSGSWRCLAYSHTEKVYDPKTRKMKDKRIYESFTSDTPGPQGKREAEFAAAQFQRDKSRGLLKKRQEYGNMKLTEAIDRYIEMCKSLNRSPTTIQDYECIQKNAFPDLMHMKLKDIDEDMLQDAITVESKRSSNGNSRKTISGNYITIREVVVDVNGEPIRKDMAKNPTRNRRHRIPAYIKELIDRVQTDELVAISGRALYHRWIRLQKSNGMEPITFHDLRHLNASIMALLRIPDKYAQEHGEWKSDKVMKGVYMQIFSEERVRVDDIMDRYFEEIMQHEMQHDIQKAQ